MAGESAESSADTGDIDRQDALTPTRVARKVVIGVVGGTVTAAGAALLVLPGPGTPVILAGLAILATEFEVARKALDKGKAKARQFFDRRK